MDKLAAVRGKFILSLQEKAEPLQIALQEAVASGQSNNLEALVHKIAGSAGFYGQADVAAMATAIDDELKVKQNSVLPESLQQEIGKLISVMQTIADQAPKIE